MNNKTLKCVCEGAIIVALALVLSYIKVPIGLAFGGFGGSRQRRNGPIPGDDIGLNVTITFEELSAGGMVVHYTSTSTGETALVRTTYGYHIMYYVSGEPEWLYYSRILAQEDVMDAMEAELDKILEENPPEINRENIFLQNVYAREQ